MIDADKVLVDNLMLVKRGKRNYYVISFEK